MKAGEYTLALLVGALRKQDQMNGRQDRRQGQLTLLNEGTQPSNERPNAVVRTQQAHQQALRTLADGQPRQHGEPEDIRDLVDTIAHMQRDQHRRLDRLAPWRFCTENQPNVR